MVDRESGALMIDGATATVDSLDNHIVIFAWRAGDTDTPGDYRGWFSVDYGSGITESFPSCDSDGINISIE